MNSRSLFRTIFWGLIALIVLFHIAGGWYFSSELIADGFTPDATPLASISGDYELEEVRYDTPLGAMDAWYLPASGTTWVIHVHGKGPTPAEAEPFFGPLQEAGYPQLAITYRNDDQQPRDPSGYYQYGVTEFTDIDGAMDYALENGAEKVVFNGLSTGASHVLAFMFRQRSDRIGGVLMDSPNIDFGETVDFNASQRKLPLVPFNVPFTVTAVAKFITSLRIGVNWVQIDYIDRTSEALNKPVLVHHGTDDETVPIEESIRFAEEDRELITLVKVEGAAHVESFDVDFDAYMSRVLSFLEEFG